MDDRSRKGHPGSFRHITCCRCVRLLHGRWYVLCALLLALLAPYAPAKAQHDLKTYVQAQKELFPIILARPAEAKPVLDSLMRHDGQVPDTVLAQTCILLGIYYGVTGQHAESIRHGERAVVLSKGNHPQRARFLRTVGSMYRNASRLSESRQRSKEAIDLHVALGDSAQLALDLSELASVYRLELRYDSAVACLVRSLALMDADPLTDQRRNRLVTRQKLGNSYLSMGRYDLAQGHLEEAMTGLHGLGDISNYGAAGISSVECRIGLDDLNGAQTLLNDLLPDLRAFGNTELLFLALGHQAELHVLRGDSARGGRNYEEAVRLGLDEGRPAVVRLASGFLRVLVAKGEMERAKALAENSRLDSLLVLTDLETRSQFFEAKGMTLLALGRNAEGMRYMTRSELAQDSLEAKNTMRATREIQDRYQADLLKKEKDFSELQLGMQRRINIFLAFALAMVVALGGYYIHAYRLRSRLKNKELDAARREQQLLQERVDAEARLAALRQDNIDQLKLELVNSARENDALRHHLGSLVQQMDTGMDLALRDDDGNLNPERKQWDFLMARFNLAYPAFTKELLKHCPELSKGEVEFCALLKLNLSYKEIANVLGIAADSIAKKKYRITQKMRMNGEVTLEALIHSVG
jgi:tetratricopeptide (TPR) repeat protein